MTFVLGPKSLQELVGVTPPLVECVKRAIRRPELTVDFAVHDGLRTIAEQRAYLASGASQTLNSKHLPQADGHGHAVDLVPYVNGKLRWEWPLIYPIVQAMYRASIELELELVWGGVWDRQLDELAIDSLEDEVEAYVARRRAKGKKAFTDGPHFETW